MKGPRGLEMRPTSDRLKEALFNILSPVISGSVVLDVFAGSGAIGLEALSRGAREVLFVEDGREGCVLIRKNLELCGISAGYRLIQRDAFTAVHQLEREGFRADIVYLDPPYRWQPYRDLLGAVFGPGVAHERTEVIVEHHRKADLPESGSGYRRHRTVRQGDQCISFYSAAASEDGTAEWDPHC